MLAPMVGAAPPCAKFLRPRGFCDEAAVDAFVFIEEAAATGAPPGVKRPSMDLRALSAVPVRFRFGDSDGKARKGEHSLYMPGARGVARRMYEANTSFDAHLHEFCTRLFAASREMAREQQRPNG